MHFMKSMGYDGIIQQKKNSSMTFANAIFFKKSVFKVVWSEHRSHAIAIALHYVSSNGNDQVSVNLVRYGHLLLMITGECHVMQRLASLKVSCGYSVRDEGAAGYLCSKFAFRRVAWETGGAHYAANGHPQANGKSSGMTSHWTSIDTCSCFMAAEFSSLD